MTNLFSQLVSHRARRKILHTDFRYVLTLGKEREEKRREEVPSFCSVGRSVGKVGTWSVLLYLVGTGNVSLLHPKLFIISLSV